GRSGSGNARATLVGDRRAGSRSPRRHHGRRHRPARGARGWRGDVLHLSGDRARSQEPHVPAFPVPVPPRLDPPAGHRLARTSGPRRRKGEGGVASAEGRGGAFAHAPRRVFAKTREPRPSRWLSAPTTAFGTERRSPAVRPSRIPWQREARNL